MLESDVIAAAPIPETGLDRLADGPLELETDRGSLSVSLESVGEPIRLNGDLIGEREARRTRVKGTLTDNDRRIDLDCPGVLHCRVPGDTKPALTRDATIILDDGGLISLATARLHDDTTHDEEQAAAAVSHPGGYVEFDQVLLSTEYDEAGRQRRATVELWPASDEIAGLHGAGHAIAGCSAKVGDRVINTALFQWSLDGNGGRGRYEISTHSAVPAQ